jgi:tetratricopeptide (TPR) repeat protein
MAITAVQVGAQGLSGEFMTSDRWRHVYSRHSGISNPAFINEENYLSLRFMFANTLQHFYMHEAGVTLPLGLHDAAGLAWMMQSAGSYEATGSGGEPLGITVTDQTNIFALTYASNLWSRLTVGGNMNIILQNVPDENANNTMRFGLSLDVGLSWKLLRHQLLGNHIVGMSTNNIVHMMLGDTEDAFTNAFRLSLLSDFWERRVFYGADFVLKDFVQLMEGGDVWPTPDDPGWVGRVNEVAPWEFTQKLGFDILRLFRIYVLAGFNPEGFDHYGFAFGVNMPGFFNGRDIEGLMQFVSVGDSEANHVTFYARTELGKHREEIYARKMARLGALGPNNLYNQALELFHRGEYYRAYWIFSQLAVEYPDFFRNDMVSYYQGACLEFMDMRLSSEATYKRTKEEFSRSIAVPYADLGLMRLYYRSGNHPAVDTQFELLNALGVPDSIRLHANYIMGQAHMQRGEFVRARELFVSIPEGHPDFVFAFHSAAVANMMADNLQGAIADLELVIAVEPRNRAEEEMINRSFVFLGLLFYEDLTIENALPRAVTALRRVPRTSYYFTDALLGLGWTAIKARQWSDCITAGAELVRVATDPVLQSEGLLIQAYAHSQNRNFPQAVTLLDDALRRLNAYTPPAEAELAQNRGQYRGVRVNYENIGMRINELGQARQSSVVLSSIDSLAGPATRTKSAIDQHHRFEDEYRRRAFFSRSYQTVKDDVEYAMARFARHATAVPTRDTGVDDELERLRRELEGLE